MVGGATASITAAPKLPVMQDKRCIFQNRLIIGMLDLLGWGGKCSYYEGEFAKAGMK